MFLALILLAAIVHIGGKLGNYDIKNHPLDIRVRRDVRTLTDEYVRKALEEMEATRNLTKLQGDLTDEKGESTIVRDGIESNTVEWSPFVSEEKEKSTEADAEIETVEEHKQEKEVNQEDSGLISLIYRYVKEKRFPSNLRAIETPKVTLPRVKRNLDNRNYYDNYYNNQQSISRQNLTNHTRSNGPTYTGYGAYTGNNGTNIMSLYSRPPYQYNTNTNNRASWYDRTGNFPRAPDNTYPSNGFNPNTGYSTRARPIYRTNPISYNRPYQTGPYDNNFNDKADQFGDTNALGNTAYSSYNGQPVSPAYAPAFTTGYAPPTTTTENPTSPIIVESCFMCVSMGCPAFFKKIGFLCVPVKQT
ncbi:unnamed protein product, partial [Iphiclides podalirius]